MRRGDFFFASMQEAPDYYRIFSTNVLRLWENSYDFGKIATTLGKGLHKEPIVNSLVLRLWEKVLRLWVVKQMGITESREKRMTPASAGC